MDLVTAHKPHFEIVETLLLYYTQSCVTSIGTIEKAMGVFNCLAGPVLARLKISGILMLLLKVVLSCFRGQKLQKIEILHIVASAKMLINIKF